MTGVLTCALPIFSGSITITEKNWAYSGKKLDVRFRNEDLTIVYCFTGAEDEEGFYLTGEWSTSLPGVCSRCTEDLNILLDAQYDKVYLKDGDANSLQSDFDVIECWLINFDLLPWVLSEVIIQVPISPSHEDCVITEQKKVSQVKNTIQLDKKTIYHKD